MAAAVYQDSFVTFAAQPFPHLETNSDASPSARTSSNSAEEMSIAYSPVSPSSPSSRSSPSSPSSSSSSNVSMAQVSPSPSSPSYPVRLSLNHGTSLDTIVEYVTALGNSLRRRHVLKMRDSWTPLTPDVKQCYRFVREVGRGHFGVVRLCEDRASGETFACKTINKVSIKKEEDVSELCSEVISMLRLQQKLTAHHNIVRLQEVLDDEDSLHLVMEFCSGGDLFDHISHQKRLSEKEAAHILKQLVSAVKSMHSCGLVHRDLKPENVLLARPKSSSSSSSSGGSGLSSSRSKPDIKVADFGLCVQLRQGQTARGVAGSPFYMAPEVIRGKSYGKEVDVWSLGVILYTSLAGSLPFWGKGHEAVFAAVLKAKPDFGKKPWPLVSPEAKHLIRSMLEPDPVRRMSLHEVLLHPWMQQHCPELQRLQQQGGAQQQQQQASQRQQQQQQQNGQGRVQQSGQSKVQQVLGSLQVKAAWTSRYVPSQVAATLAVPLQSRSPRAVDVARGSPREEAKPAEVPVKTSTTTAGNGDASASTQVPPCAEGKASPVQLSDVSQRYGSPTWVLELAARRMDESRNGAAAAELSRRESGAVTRNHEVIRTPTHDLHLIPSPPRASPVKQSPCSSPSLLHKVQAAISLSHPFPRMYLPFASPQCSPAVSPFHASPANMFSERAEGQQRKSPLSAQEVAPARDIPHMALTVEDVPCAGVQQPSGGLEKEQGLKVESTLKIDAYKKLSVFISSPSCLSPVDSAQMSPGSSAEVAEAMRLKEELRTPSTPLFKTPFQATPYALADSLVSALFSPACAR